MTIEQINQQSIDLEKATIDKVLDNLKVDPEQGLSEAEAKNRLGIYGINGIEEKETPFWVKLLRRFKGPIAYMIEAAAIVSAIIGHWEDFAIIVTLLLFNVVIEMWQDNKASNALTALKNGLALEALAKRDGKWQTVEAKTLVPGDIVKIRLGQIVPADLRLLKGEYASIDQAALTGESLPVNKKVGEFAFSGSIVKQGEMEAVVIATGGNTFFGRTAKLVANAGSTSHAQKAMFQIGNFLIICAVILAIILVAFQVYYSFKDGTPLNGDAWLDILEFVLVLLVASIPVAMPTVFSITMALGALELSRHKAIVSKLSSIEEMAGVDILCSDKTGTLTKNLLTVGEPVLITAQHPQECFLAAALASRGEDKDAIDSAMIASLKDQSLLKEYSVKKYTPFDPVSKRSQAIVIDQNGHEIWVTKGAPQIIAHMCRPELNEQAIIAQAIADFAKRGSRALSVARSDDKGTTWKLLGILPMFDPPRDDSKDTIEKANAKGVAVKMITGDDTAIAIEMSRQLGMGTNIITASEIFPKDMDPDNVPEEIVDTIEHADGFARVYPEHKYAIVKSLQKRGHIVAMTGDGVNDAPALKQADCGTAVQGATDAARSAAALILTAPGLSVINTAIDEARQIFARITSYTIYRVALTMSIMMLVVFSSIVLDFTCLSAVMIVIISLLDDIPIMTIAYDRTDISPTPIRWQMGRLLPLSGMIGLFSVIQSILLLVVGYLAIKHHDVFTWLDLSSDINYAVSHGFTPDVVLQTIMFLQVVVGGHLLLFITRSEGWFFTKPYPAGILFWSIMGTQLIAVLMCLFGWVVPKISWEVVVGIYIYDFVWMWIINIVRIATDAILSKGGKKELSNNKHMAEA